MKRKHNKVILILLNISSEARPFSLFMLLISRFMINSNLKNWNIKQCNLSRSDTESEIHCVQFSSNSIHEDFFLIDTTKKSAKIIVLIAFSSSKESKSNRYDYIFFAQGYCYMIFHIQVSTLHAHLLESKMKRRDEPAQQKNAETYMCIDSTRQAEEIQKKKHHIFMWNKINFFIMQIFLNLHNMLYAYKRSICVRQKGSLGMRLRIIQSLFSVHFLLFFLRKKLKWRLKKRCIIISSLISIRIFVVVFLICVRETTSEGCRIFE